MIKIYVHNFFTVGLLKKLTHNSEGLEISRSMDITEVKCHFKSVDFHFVFDPKINFNTDGYHFIDYYSIESDFTKYKEYLEFTDEDNLDQSKVYKRLFNKIKDEKNWIILVIRTEKLLTKVDLPDLDFASKDEFYLSKMKNHYILNDGFFLGNTSNENYDNFYSVFTNTVFQWNEYCGINWYYDFGKIYSKLNFDYDIGYSVRRIKRNRKKLLQNLSELNNPKIFLSVTDYGGSELTNLEKYHKELNFENIHFNSITGNTDFFDISYVPNIRCPGIDVFLRILSKSKLQILDESWAHHQKNYIHQYLSEKTLGLLLAGIPFISTHNYPLDIIQKVLKVNDHPFYEESKRYAVDPKGFSEFVDNFLKNFGENFQLCLDWSLSTKKILLDYISSNNDFLQLFVDGKINLEKKLIKLL